METSALPSLRLFQPIQNFLAPYQGTAAEKEKTRIANSIRQEIEALLSQKNYPCVAALKSFHKNDYQLGLYGKIGQGTPHRDLRKDLLFFLKEQRRTKSTYLSFWAVYEPQELSEEDFEKSLWQELSLLTSEAEKAGDWAPQSVADPADPAFRFSLGGAEFFIVGLHANSSRRARRFSRPVLIFNVWDQFSELIKKGQYQPMIEINRERDQKFQGDANPMAVAHGDQWESIQFSGRNNPKEWKCPFAFLKSFKKQS